jgi:hypothetical protein
LAYFELGVELPSVTTSDSYSHRVFEFIQHCLRNGSARDLVRAAYHLRPKNPQIRGFVQRHFPGVLTSGRGAGATPPVGPDGERVRLMVLIREDIKSFGYDRLAALLAELRRAGLDGDIWVIAMLPGSTRLLLDVTPEDAGRLARAFEAGALAWAGVVGLQRLGPAPPGLPSPPLPPWGDAPAAAPELDNLRSLSPVNSAQ